MTLSAFEQFIAREENIGRLFEFIHGQLVEVMPGRTRYSEMAQVLAFAVRLFCRERGLPCHTSGGDGAYRIQGHVLAPDFAFKRTSMSEDYPDPTPPEWAVEIISPTDKAADIREKREIYRQASILLWEIYPQTGSVDVYAPGQPPRIYSPQRNQVNNAGADSAAGLHPGLVSQFASAPPPARPHRSSFLPG